MRCSDSSRTAPSSATNTLHRSVVGKALSIPERQEFAAPRHSAIACSPMTNPNLSATDPAPRSLFGEEPDSTVKRESRLVGVAFALTIFLSAFLLFQVQPLI